MPSPATAQLWAERTPADFVMNVKSFRLFTGHQTSPAVLHRDIQQALPPAARRNWFYKDFPVDLREELWRRFHEALMPLRAAGKLGLVHFQFPPWVMCNREGHAHVAHCVRAFRAGLECQDVDYALNALHFKAWAILFHDDPVRTSSAALSLTHTHVACSLTVRWLDLRIDVWHK